MDQPHPVVRYLIVCEDVQVDPDNPQRITLIGLISAIRLGEGQTYPLLSPELCVYLQLTECRGPAEGRIEVRHGDSDQVLFSTRTRTIPFGSDPLSIVGITFRIRNCLFPGSGLYWVQFWYNEQMITQQPVLLR